MYITYGANNSRHTAVKATINLYTLTKSVLKLS